MSGCKFTKELHRLRKSSSDSIDNVERFDEFKKYMHVTRHAEMDLKDILKRVNVAGKKSLVLLCGSAGDGKSHLLSYLKNSDEEKLLEDYLVYNDATESSAPSKTAIDTLTEVLSGFSDDRLNEPGKSIILAINLGVLSNFIESEYGEHFQDLKKYVEKSNILTSQINDNHFDENCRFQHVSFSDYHMYSLKSGGASPKYIEDILEKIFMDLNGNPFYSSYTSDCSVCTLSQKCPIKKNYEFMMERNHQKYIANLLIKSTIKDKEILTTREILNYLYDILVPQDFSFTKLQKLLINDANFLKEFIKEITPVLMFDYSDLTTLMNRIRKYDPLLIRSENADELAISYYVSSDITKNIEETLEESPYESILCDKSLIPIINDDKSLKSQVFNVLVRINLMKAQEVVDEIYQGYLKNMYLYNAGKYSGLSSIYSMVEKGIVQWCGSEAEGNICLDDKHNGFVLYEYIKFEEYLDNVPICVNSDELQRFIPAIIVEFESTKNHEIIPLYIDYSLYELIYKLNHGYTQTADDRNNHADFISFISKILRTGSASESLIVVSENKQKANIEKSKFGYKFKVVR